MENQKIAVLAAIRPPWIPNILNELKTAEIRRRKPSIPTPFRCFMYCTEPNMSDTKRIIELHIEGEHKIQRLNGKVIGYFDCDRVDFYERAKGSFQRLGDVGCISTRDLYDYCGTKDGLYGWHITNVTIFGRPHELSEFKNKAGKPISRAPQSWQYIQMPETAYDTV